MARARTSPKPRAAANQRASRGNNDDRADASKRADTSRARQAAVSPRTGTGIRSAKQPAVPARTAATIRKQAGIPRAPTTRKQRAVPARTAATIRKPAPAPRASTTRTGQPAARGRTPTPRTSQPAAAARAPATRTGQPAVAPRAPTTRAPREATAAPTRNARAAAAGKPAPRPRGRANAGPATTPGSGAPSPTGPAARRPPPPARLSGGSAVVKVLESRQPIEALRKFLTRIPGEATREQGQIALGSAQLMLLPIAHEHRGGDEVKQLLDLVLARWDAFPDRSGFHAQEFLRNAFAAVGDDRERIARLSALVPPDATSELRFNMASAYAAVGDRPAMLRALGDALAAGASAAQVRRDPDLARFTGDPEVLALLERAAAPAIPVDVAPHIAPIRAALDEVLGTLRALGGPSQLRPPASLEAVLAAERASKIQLPNDYRALLTISDGAALWDHELFGTSDLRGDTRLAHRARAFLAMSANYGGIGMDACVPLASWGQRNHWLLYDPRGAVRDGSPGYVVMFTADPMPLADLTEALRKLADSLRDSLATN